MFDSLWQNILFLLFFLSFAAIPAFISWRISVKEAWEPKHQKECIHEYYHVGTGQYQKQFKLTYTLEELYCPKCEKRISVDYQDWKIIKEKQKVKMNYKNPLKKVGL